MAASATSHVALAPPAPTRLSRRLRALPTPTRATGVLAYAARMSSAPAPMGVRPRLCANTGPFRIPGTTPATTRRWRPRGSVLVGVRGGSEAEWEEGWRSGAGRGRGRGARGAKTSDTNNEAPADVFATVVTEGFGVSSTKNPDPESPGIDPGTSGSDCAARPARGGKRAWLKKTVWKALNGGTDVSAGAASSLSSAVYTSPSDSDVSQRDVYPEADGGALNGGMEEEREMPFDGTGFGGNGGVNGNGADGVHGALTGAAAHVGSIIADAVANGERNNAAATDGNTHANESVSGFKNGTSATGTAPGTNKNEASKKKKDKRYLAVNPPKPYEVMRINAPDSLDGPGVVRSQRLTRRALLRDADLTPRDLRRIDPSLLQTNNTPALLVKDQTIMVNLGVRVIIRPDHALLFEPDTDTGRRFLNAVQRRVKEHSSGDSSLYAGGDFGGKNGAKGNSSLGEFVSSSATGDFDLDYDLNATPGGVGGAPIPFELEMVEAALQETMSQLYAKLEFCEERCKRVSSQLRSSINPAVLEELRLTKQSLVALDSRAGSVRQVLLDTLDDDDDIADFTISSTATNEEDKEDEEEEVENLIEYYLQQTETVHNAAEQLLENTRDLEESISVSLSSRRYEVSKLELTLSIATFAAALGALVTGIFGMNLRSCLEMSISAFYLTCFLIVAGITGIFQSIMKFARRQKIL